jgi:hypothetical protein
MEGRIIYLLSIIWFMAACSHKPDSIILSKTTKVPLDESQLVLMRLPQKLRSINDSTIGVINSAQKLSLYNIYTGTNQQNFSLEKFNFDSLVHETFQKKYEGARKITYQSGYELNGTNYQLINYYPINNLFYVQVSLLAEIDSQEPGKKTNDLIEYQSDTQVITMDYLNFMFIISSDFKIQNVVPLYIESAIRKDNYYPYYHKNFIVADNNIYIPVSKMENNPDLEKKINTAPGNFCIAKTELTNQTGVNYLMSYKSLDFSDFRLQDYLSTHFSFDINRRKLFCTAKDVAELGSGTTVFHSSNLAANEWIDGFYENENENLVMTTFTTDKKNSVVISGKVCPVDSITARYLKIFNLKENSWSADHKIPVGRETVCLAKDKLIFLNKDENNYYLNYIDHHEN